MLRNSKTRLRVEPGALALLVISTLVSLGLAELLLREFETTATNSGELLGSAPTAEHMSAGLLRYDPRLGWKLAPGFSGRHQHADYLAHYRVSADGWRHDPIAEMAPAWKKRIAWLGDSFTFGLGVNDDETFVSLLNRAATRSTNDDRVHLNWSVPGYSTDQQLLALEQQLQTSRPDVIVVVVYLGNDLLDIVRDHPMQAEQAKPRFSLSASGQLHPPDFPVSRNPRPIDRDALARALLDDVPAESDFALLRAVQRLFGRQRDHRATLKARMQPNLALFAAIADAFKSISTTHAIESHWILLPGRSAVLDAESISGQFQSASAAQMRTLLVERFGAGQVTNLLPVLATQADLDQLYFPVDGHLTALGHRRIHQLLGEIPLLAP